MTCIFADRGRKFHDFSAAEVSASLGNPFWKLRTEKEMLFAVFFTDDPSRSEARSRLMDDHLSFLDRNGAFIRAAGPLRNVPSGEGVGGLWLVEAEDLAAVEALYQSDPLWPTGLRKSVKVFGWRQVFAEGMRLNPAD